MAKKSGTSVTQQNDGETPVTASQVMKPEASPLHNPGSPLRQQRDSGYLHGREIDPGRVAQREHAAVGDPAGVDR